MMSTTEKTTYNDVKHGVLLHLAVDGPIKENSENPKALVPILKDIQIWVKEKFIAPYFVDDKESRIVLIVKVIRDEKEVEFDFGMSTRDTDILTREKDKSGRIDTTPSTEVLKDLSYSILTCLGSEYHIDPDFECFCSEFGYDTDSIKATELHKRCVKQSKKIKSLFTEEEIESFPR